MRELCISTSLNSAEWAAWVQAISASIAIVLALVIPLFQGWRDREKASRAAGESVARRLHEVNVLSVELVDAIAALQEAGKPFQPAGASAMDHARRVDLLERLRVIDIFDLPWTALAHIREIRALLLRLPEHGAVRTDAPHLASFLHERMIEARGLTAKVSAEANDALRGRPLPTSVQARETGA